MRKQVSTTYPALLTRICDSARLPAASVSHLRRLLRSRQTMAIAFATHEEVRHLVRRGTFTLREGRLDQPGARIVAADNERGHLYALPDLVTASSSALHFSLDPALGPGPSFDAEQMARHFHEESRRTLSSVESTADVKGIVVGILDLLRDLLASPTALCFTRTLPMPSGIGRGTRELLAGPRDASGRQWQPWVDAAAGKPESLLYFPDCRLCPRAERPVPAGSALLIPLVERQPAWDAVLVALWSAPYALTGEGLARVRTFAGHFRRQLNFALHLQTVISYDFLTAVYNRRFIEDHMARVLADAARREQSFALLIVDIDDFKAFNSRYGYDAGDAVLRAVAGSLKRALRTTDVLARYGGEEFAAILAPPVSRAEASRIAERLRAAVVGTRVEIPTLSGGRADARVSISTGGALFPEDGTARDELWNRANRMLLAAKAAGKNRVRFPWRGTGC